MMALRVLLILVLLVASGCNDSTSSFFGTTAPRHDDTILWTNNGSEPEWIDPGKCGESAGSTLVYNLFSGLLQPHPKTLEPMPDIATHWKKSEDGRTYTFYLRESTWSDGHPFTAHDLEWSWKRVLDPKTDSRYASFLWTLKNGEAFNRGATAISNLPPGTTIEELTNHLGPAIAVEKIELDIEDRQAFLFLKSQDDQKKAMELMKDKPFKDILLEVTPATRDHVGVKALNNLTLEVNLQNPIPYFLSVIMFYTTMPVPRHAIERLEKEGKNPELWTRPEYIVSNGAYNFKEWKFRQYMLLEKNERYWDSKNTRTRHIRLEMTDSYNTSLNIYKTGQFDWIGENMNLPSEFLQLLSKYSDYSRSPYLAVYFYWINTKAPPMDNPKIRQAMSLAIDRVALVNHITRGNQQPYGSLIPDGLAGYKGLDLPLFDPKRAKELIKEAGYNDPSEIPPITLKYNTSEGHKQIAEAIQQMWKKHLGITVEIANQEWKVFLKDIQAYDFQIGRMGWIGDYPDPYTFMELLVGANGNNHSNWKSPTYDNMLKEANSLNAPQARLDLLREAEAMAMKDTPVIPLYVYTRSDMWKPYVKGLWPNFQNRHPFKYIWIDTRFKPGLSDEELERLAALDNEPPPMPELPQPQPEENP